MEIKRTITEQVRQHLMAPEITLLVGPRQVGKTTLINGLSAELRQRGEKTLNLNLDIEDDFSLVKTQAQLIRRLELEFGRNKGYVFIDEIQRKENAGKFFKGIYDMNLPYKFILTGSGSVELKEKVSESLAGRKQMFEMRPVSFFEFIDFRTNYNYSDRLKSFLLNNDNRLELLLQEYLQFGGYPRVILAETLERKRLEMQEIYTSYLEKDIVQLLKVQKTESLAKLLTLLASQIGEGINIGELSNTLDLDAETTRNYIWYLEKTFILKTCRPYYTNPRAELSKTPIYYFIDLGMRNYVLNRYSSFDLTLDGGHLFENFILNYLYDKYEHLAPLINYWRTKDGAEVDFIFKLGANVLPIEVKYQRYTKPTASRALYNFIAKYNPARAYVVNLSLDERVKKDTSQIIFKPYYQFLAEDLEFR